MKIIDRKTGDVFDNIGDARRYFCKKYGGSCIKCPVRLHGNDWNCFSYVWRHPADTAKLMGMEVIEDDGCDPEWSEAGKKFYKSLLDPYEAIEDTPMGADGNDAD